MRLPDGALRRHIEVRFRNRFLRPAGSRRRRCAGAVARIWLAAGAALAAAAVATAFLARNSITAPAKASVASPVPSVVPSTGPEAGYAGSSSCAECHPGIAKSFSEVAMGRSMATVEAAPVIEDYESTTAEFFHERSNQTFRVTRKDGRHYQERWQTGPAGERINEKRIEAQYIMGSGAHARSYLAADEDGRMVQMPVAWYERDKKWALNPGYDSPAHGGFSRAISYDCAFCHAAYPAIPAGADHSRSAGEFLFPEGLHPIDCERCHGPSARHVELARVKAPAAEIAAATLNPASLATNLQLDVCMQCHLEVTSGKLPDSVRRENRSSFSYRPGDPLSDYKVHFDHPSGAGHDDKFEIAGQGYRMLKSTCFQASDGKMTCTTCHDPHKTPKNKTAAGIASCLSCHTDASCTEKPAIRLSASNNCIQCHMPERRTEDVIHVVMHDHAIPRFARPPAELLAPRTEEPRDYKGDLVLYSPHELTPEDRVLYLGVGLVQDGANPEKGIALLTDYLTSHPESFIARMSRARGYTLTGRAGESMSDLVRAVELQPENYVPRLLMAEDLLNAGETTRALTLFQELVQAKPRLPEIFEGLGKALAKAGRPEDAAAAFRRQTELSPLTDRPWIELGLLRGNVDDHSSATEYFRKALSINPSSHSVWTYLAQALAGQKNPDWKTVLWHAAQGVRINPAHDESFDVLRQLVERVPVTEQTSVLENVRSSIPFESDVLLLKLALRNRNAIYGQTLLSRLIPAVSTTSNSMALAEAGNSSAQFGRYDAAREIYRRALILRPHVEASVIGLADALLHGDAAGEAAAGTLLQKELLVTTDSARLCNAAAFLLATARDPAVRNGPEAERLARQAADLLGGHNGHTQDALAAALAAQGRFAEAEELLRGAVAAARKQGGENLARRLEGRLPYYGRREALTRGTPPLN